MHDFTSDQPGNCSHSAISSNMLFDGPLSTVVIAAGVIGNLYCLRVLFRTSINTSMLVSLTGLAIWDVVLLIAAFLHHSLWASLYYFQLRDRSWDPYLVALNGLMECAHVTSTWMLIEVSAERFFAVTRPFHFASNMRKQRRESYVRIIGGMIRMPLIMTLVACLFTLPCSFEYYLEPCLDKGRELLQRQETTMMRNAVYHVLYRTIVLSVMKTFGPFVIITLLTVSTVKSLRHSMDNRGTILMQQGKDHLFAADKDKTKSLQTISMLLLGKFLLLRCWPTSLEMLRVFFGENVLSHAPVLSFDGSEFCLLLNSATNAFVFVVLKSAFETRRNNILQTA
ncbi:unnamed protein product [Nippostrongylus brasiliensis]|uniref:G_PROTEIN_RECEP_F1_2 domain-containing protein n=1 Tax=Nippostrongylus brasiliensis TaxID=27835 RepID=A0A0N4XVA7_NIPBR|nr:unnamed protein product [Nippostrongylus brasiliensis]